MQRNHTFMEMNKCTYEWVIHNISGHFNIHRNFLHSPAFETNHGDKHQFRLILEFSNPSSLSLFWHCFPSACIEYQLYVLNDEGEKKCQIVNDIEHNSKPWLEPVDKTENWYGQKVLKIEEQFIKTLTNNILTVGCHVTAYYKPNNIISTYKRKPSISIADQIAKVFKNQDGADFTFNVDNQTFTAHKFMLSLRSPVFRRMFETNMMEKSINEATSNVRSEIFKLLLEFIYTDKTEKVLNAKHAMELFAAADYYQIEDLKEYCFQSLSEVLNMKNAMDIRAFAKQHNNEQLISSASEILKENIDSILDSIQKFPEELTCSDEEMMDSKNTNKN